MPSLRAPSDIVIAPDCTAITVRNFSRSASGTSGIGVYVFFLLTAHLRGALVVGSRCSGQLSVPSHCATSPSFVGLEGTSTTLGELLGLFVEAAEGLLPRRVE